MSSDFPPVIIDSLRASDETLFEQYGGMFIRSADFGGGSAETATIRASITSVYLIKDNQVIHQGDYESDAVQLIYGNRNDQTMAAGRDEPIPGVESGLDAGAAAVQDSVTQPSRRVTKIGVPDRAEPLVFGHDFHNFMLILRQKTDV
jgi:hypothetical protein